LYQGTTLVVPQRQKNRWALAPAAINLLEIPTGKSALPKEFA